MVESFYVFSNGELQRKDNVLRITAADGKFKDIKVEMTRDLYIFGEVSLNTKALNYAGQLSIPLHFFNYYGFYTGSFYPKEKLNSGMLFVEQVKNYIDNERRVNVAREILKAASFNIYRNLRYYNERGKNLSGEMKFIENLKKKFDLCKTIEELMGIEGNIRKKYYEAFNIIINQEVNFEKRVKHPPDNMINSMISYVNTLVYTTVLSEIYHTQLTPLVSFLHQPGERRFSLSLDIAEIFKPLIADRLIFSMLNKNQITESDFKTDLNFIYLKEDSRKKILQEYDTRISKTIRHRVLGRDVSYRYLIRLELYKLVKHIIGEKDYEGFKIWW